MARSLAGGKLLGQLGSVRFRETVEGDVDFAVSLESAPENARFVAVWDRSMHLAAIDGADLAHWIVEDASASSQVGYIILAGLQNPHHSIEFMRIVISAKGRGYGRDSIRLVKELAFTKLGAHRLWLDVFDYNARARKLYASEGFVEEGLLRDSYQSEDGYKSLVVMSILESEYGQWEGLEE